MNNLNQDIFDNIVENSTDVSPEDLPKVVKKPKIPKPIKEKLLDDIAENAESNNNKIADKKTKKKNIDSRTKDKDTPKKLEKLDDDKYAVVNEIVKTEIESVEDVVIPENVDIASSELAIYNSVEAIPTNVEVSDLEFTPVTKINKRGYHTVKAAISKKNIPDVMIKLVAYINKATKHVVTGRITDVRIIATVNKTQLRSKSDDLKLTERSITIKPKKNKVLAGKSHRIIITAPTTYDNDHELVIYMQDGRNHDSLHIHRSSNASDNDYISWIADRIVEFYYKGYEITYNKILLRSKDNPLMDVIDNVLSSYEYKVQPMVDNDEIIAAVFYNKGSKNKWLCVRVDKIGVNAYIVNALYKNNTYDSKDFEQELALTKPNKETYTIKDLLDNLKTVLDKAFNYDWSKIIGIQTDIDRMKNLYSELEYRPTRYAFEVIMDIIESGNSINISIDSVIHADDRKSKGLTGEAIVGSSDYCEFTLSYERITLYEQYNRDSKQYITSQKYYKDFNIKTREPYQNRKGALGVKEGSSRNYHGGMLAFKIDYTSKGKNWSFVAKTFDEIMEKTGFTTDTVMFPTSEYDKYLKPKR